MRRVVLALLVALSGCRTAANTRMVSLESGTTVFAGREARWTTRKAASSSGETYTLEVVRGEAIISMGLPSRPAVTVEDGSLRVGHILLDFETTPGSVVVGQTTVPLRDGYVHLFSESTFLGISSK